MVQSTSEGMKLVHWKSFTVWETCGEKKNFCRQKQWKFSIPQRSIFHWTVSMNRFFTPGVELCYCFTSSTIANFSPSTRNMTFVIIPPPGFLKNFVVEPFKERKNLTNLDRATQYSSHHGCDNTASLCITNGIVRKHQTNSFLSHRHRWCISCRWFDRRQWVDS